MLNKCNGYPKLIQALQDCMTCKVEIVPVIACSATTY